MVSIQHDLVVQRYGGTIMIELPSGDLTRAQDLDRVYNEVEKIIQANPKPRIVMSFDHVNHLSSMFLGKLIALNRRIKEQGGQLSLTNIKPRISEIFKLTKLDSQIPIIQQGKPPAADTGPAWLALASAIGGVAILAAIMIYRGSRQGWSRFFQDLPASMMGMIVTYIVAAVALVSMLMILRRPGAAKSYSLQWYLAALIALLSVAGVAVMVMLG